MPRFREKKDPARIRNWIGQLRFAKGDTIVLHASSGVSGIGGEVVSAWTGDALTDTVGIDEWAAAIVGLAQDHCNASGSRSHYRVTHERKAEVLATFSIKLLPEDGDDSGDDEDASPAGQIRAQMAHTRQIMHLAMRTPIAAMEMTGKQLEMAYARIAQLEAERAVMLDTYAEALQLVAAAEASQTPPPSISEQATELAKVVPLLMSGIRSVVKV